MEKYYPIGQSKGDRMSKTIEEIAHNYFRDPEFYSRINREVLDELDGFRSELYYMAADILREVKLYGQCTITGSDPLLLADPRNIALTPPAHTREGVKELLNEANRLVDACVDGTCGAGDTGRVCSRCRQPGCENCIEQAGINDPEEESFYLCRRCSEEMQVDNTEDLCGKQT